MRDKQRPPDGYAEIIDESIDDLNERGDLRSAGLDKKRPAQRARKGPPLGMLALVLLTLLSVSLYAYLKMSAPRNVVSREEADKEVLDAAETSTDEGPQRAFVLQLLHSVTNTPLTAASTRADILSQFERYIQESADGETISPPREERESAE